jgi:hypothetical protein
MTKNIFKYSNNSKTIKQIRQNIILILISILTISQIFCSISTISTPTPQIIPTITNTICPTLEITKTIEPTICPDEIMLVNAYPQGLNLRKQPSDKAEIILTISDREKVIVKEKLENGWFMVEYNSVIGFVNSTYLRTIVP